MVSDVRGWLHGYQDDGVGAINFIKAVKKKETQKLVPKTEGLFFKIIIVWFISWEFPIQ